MVNFNSFGKFTVLKAYVHCIPKTPREDISIIREGSSSASPLGLVNLGGVVQVRHANPSSIHRVRNILGSVEPALLNHPY